MSEDKKFDPKVFIWYCRSCLTVLDVNRLDDWRKKVFDETGHAKCERCDELYVKKYMKVVL